MSRAGGEASVFRRAVEYLTMGKFVASQSELPRGLGREGNTALPDRRFPKIVTVAWLTLGIASVSLSLIAALVLRSERESTAILHHLNVISLNLQDVLSDLADAEAAERVYLLTRRSTSLENFKRSRKALGLEFERLTALVKNNPAEQQEVERVRHLVQQDLDELQKSIASRTAGGSRAASAEILTVRARKLTEALRQSITGIGEEQQGTLARLARKRRVRLTSALAAVSGALLLAAFYLLIGQIIIARSASRRQRSEEALRASEKRFKALCEQSPLGIYSTDAHGLCVYTNFRWSQMSGLSAAESLGHGWTRALHPDDRETVFESWKTNALQGGLFDSEYRLLTPQGEIRWFRDLGAPIYSDRGEVTGYVGTVEDITERKLAHRDLEEREALNRAVLNSLPANIAVLKGDGTIQAINEEWQRFAEANGDPPVRSVNTGVNYLEVCKRASDRGSSDAEEALTGIQDVLSGKLQSFRMQYPCHSPTEKRWFRMTVTPLAGVTTGGVAIAHADITERKQAEDAMQEALQQLQLITDNMAVGVTRCSRDLRFLWASRSYAAWQGLAPEEIANRPIVDVAGPEAYETGLPYMEKVLSGERQDFEVHVNYRGVGLRWVHAVYVPTRDNNHEVDGWIDVVTDVTERHEAEERLRESEERFRNMADTAPVMIWASGPDKRCTFLNKVWLDFTGRTMEQELGNRWAEGVHPDDLEHVLAVYYSAFDARQSFQMEYRMRRADGAYRWLLDSGVPRFTAGNVLHGYIGSCIDITERIRAEEERQKFVSLADSSLEFIGMCDHDFRPFYVNAAGMRLVGLDNLEEACRVNIKDYFFPEDQPFITNEFFPRVLRDGHGKVEIRFRHFKTGEAIWMIYNVFNICDAHRATVGWATVSVDVTERRRAELALQESRQELRALAGRLISAEEQERKRISRELHDDLNQKLACLAFDADGLRMMPFSSEDKVREQLSSLRTRIVELSKDVREISHRLHPSILEDLGLTAALHELCEEFSARDGIKVLFTPQVVPPAIPAEVAACLYRVAQEAMHNILKHARADYVQMTLSGDSRGIHLSIQDTGVGFDPESLRRPGLGIISMKERVRLVQGEFSIYSRPGQGTEVTVFVPLPKEALRPL
jgi:PAS domain S-box-containing protein